MEKMEENKSISLDGIRNIVFDLGKVLVDLDKDRCIEAFNRIGAQRVATYVEEHRTEDLFLKIEVGEMSVHEFCNEVRRLSACSALDGDIVWAWNQLLTGISEEKLKKLIEVRRAGYRTFLLSNTNEMHWHKCAEDYFPYKHYVAEDYFEKIFLSNEKGLAKPSTAIFEQVVLEADINPLETVFIDDLPANCDTARNMGFRTFRETSGTDWLRALNVGA